MSKKDYQIRKTYEDLQKELENLENEYKNYKSYVNDFEWAKQRHLDAINKQNTPKTTTEIDEITERLYNPDKEKVYSQSEPILNSNDDEARARMIDQLNNFSPLSSENFTMKSSKTKNNVSNSVNTLNVNISNTNNSSNNNENTKSKHNLKKSNMNINNNLNDNINEIRCINCTYNIDEDVQNDFGISSPIKNSNTPTDPFASPTDYVIVNEDPQDNNNSQQNHIRNDSESIISKDKGKRCTAKHCSMLPDMNAFHRMSVEDRKSGIKSSYAPTLSSFAEESSKEEQQQNMDKNPNQHNYYVENKKLTEEEYYILKVKNEKLMTENKLLQDEKSKIIETYEEKIQEEINKNESYEKTINDLLEEKKQLKSSIAKANEKLKKYEEDHKLDTLKYENENNLFQIKYEDLKAIYEKEKEERIIAESTIVRLQEELHVRYLDELKYTYIYDIESKYQNEFEVLESQKQTSLSTFEYLNNEIKKLEKEINAPRAEGDAK
ncbi:hypothetical protein PIROE2DRAFT_62254 [Piromyces sp. E2]|nr:hypothetical protein PIROE2DRAFT_62254 [Piromyces sp. E2]|eukprot:OUM61874.1 hypothetical protein PIROE2DRAFT_62254 [Piromyces sp. E2]